MVDFILALGEVINNWPENTKLTLGQISQQTKVSMPQVVEAMSYGLDRALDVHEPLSFKDTDRCHNNLRQRMHAELIARARFDEDLRRRTSDAFTLMYDKVRSMQAMKNWRGAFRTLSYFLGTHEKNLPREHMIPATEECVRLGIKAQLNLQEITVWFGKCIELIVQRPSSETLTEALDVIDTYGEEIKALSPSGAVYIQAMIQKLARPAVELQAGAKLVEVCDSLQMAVDTQPIQYTSIAC